MFRDNEKISTTQISLILILTMIGTGILTLPQSLAKEAGADGWIIILVGGFLGIVLANIYGYIIKSHPHTKYMDILSAHLSKYVAYAIVGATVIYLIILNSFVIRIFAEAIKMFLLFRTPIELIIFSLLLVSVFLVRKGIEPLGRVAEIMMPIIFLPSLFLFMLALQNAEIKNLLPVFQISIAEIVKAVPIVLFSFLGFELLFIFGFFVNKPQKISKPTNYAMIFVILAYMFLNSMTLLNFGVKQTEHLIWPTLSLFKTIEIPGLFIENVEALVMSLWVLIVFTTIAPLHLGASYLSADLLGVKDYKLFVFPMHPIIYLISMFPENIAKTYDYLDKITNFMAPTIVIVIPCILALWIFASKKANEEGGRI
ncbi:MAG: GerAB/ArcD/ProY family transporter [Alkaliphilus sp.]